MMIVCDCHSLYNIPCRVDSILRGVLSDSVIVYMHIPREHVVNGGGMW